MSGYDFVTNAGLPHVGGNIWQGDPATFAPHAIPSRPLSMRRARPRACQNGLAKFGGVHLGAWKPTAPFACTATRP